MKTLFLTLFLTLSINAINLLDYCTPNDGKDDSACFQNAVNDIVAGGTLHVDAGVWDMQGMVSFITYTNGNNSITVKGEKHAVIKPDYNGMVFYAGMQNQIVFENLIFLGDGVTTNHDASYLIYFAGGAQSRIRGCQFYGVKATNSVIYATDTDLVITDTVFHGLSSSVASVEVYNARGLTVENSEFIDYANYNGTYYSKTSQGVGAWIKATATAHPPANATANRGVKISNVRFDEGALKTMILTNLRYVDIEHILVNVVGVTYGAGIIFDNVRLATVTQSFFGYSGNARPAMVLKNNTKVKAEGITLGAAVFSHTQDGTSVAYISQCDEC